MLQKYSKKIQIGKSYLAYSRAVVMSGVHIILLNNVFDIILDIC